MVHLHFKTYLINVTLTKQLKPEHIIKYQNKN